jgi:hypothetical protein
VLLTGDDQLVGERQAPDRLTGRQFLVLDRIDAVIEGLVAMEEPRETQADSLHQVGMPGVGRAVGTQCRCLMLHTKIHSNWNRKDAQDAKRTRSLAGPA